MTTYYRKNYVAVQFTDPDNIDDLNAFGCQLYNDLDNQLCVQVGDDLVPIPLNGWVVKAPGDPADRFLVRTDEDFHQQFSVIVDGVAAAPPDPPAQPAQPPAGDPPADPGTPPAGDPPAAPDAPATAPATAPDAPPAADPAADPADADTEPPAAPAAPDAPPNGTP